MSDHPALLSDADLDAIYQEWRNKRQGNSRERDRMMALAAVRKLVEWLEAVGSVQGGGADGMLIVEGEDWLALRSAVGLDKEGE